MNWSLGLADAAAEREIDKQGLTVQLREHIQGFVVMACKGDEPGKGPLRAHGIQGFVIMACKGDEPGEGPLRAHGVQGFVIMACKGGEPGKGLCPHTES